MTTLTSSTATSAGRRRSQDAKARFSDVVLDAQKYRSLQGAQIGQALVEALRASPHQDVGLELAAPAVMPVRDVEL